MKSAGDGICGGTTGGDAATAAVVGLSGAAILVWLFRFNYSHGFGDEYLLVNCAAILWLPMLVVLLGLRQDPRSLGFGVGDLRQGMKWAAALMALMLPLLLFASLRPEYRNYYPMDQSAAVSRQRLLLFELEYGFYLFCWEFFFRGYLLFGLGRALRYRGGVGRVSAWMERGLGDCWRLWPAAFAQTIPFGIMHYGKPEFALSFISGLALAALAIRGKSFLPCFVLHWGISMALDIMVVVGRHSLVC